ncbi:MAG TPA: TauD/TfdA family dioxygenase [Caulobacteraceae bacterium]|nr:TauD/TfdA family dioxygenase [Caulobacteraceae bacterium]
MLKTRLKIEKAPGCGAYMRDIDLGRIDAAQAGELRAALFEHGVLFFRGQSLSPEQHIALAEAFGPIDVNRFFPAAPGYPMIAKVEKTAEQTSNIGGGWHTDHSYDAEPAMGSILVARDLPPKGGDTLFADLYAAFESLDAETRAEIAGLRAVHGSEHVFGEAGAYAAGDQTALVRPAGEKPETVHPVVIRHPGSGKPALYVNPGFTLRFEGMSTEASRPLLTRLYAHAIHQSRVHRFVWEPGSVAIWDNRASWHFALNDYQGCYRLMHRITMAGEALAAA